MSCHKDANCEAAEHVTQRRAVARMSFFENGSMYLCSGTLLNDRKNSGTPYFLTAHHCIHSDTAAATLETRWFYWSTTCGSRTLNPEHRILRGGADLLHSSPNPDIALLRLKEMPPPGALFAGWDSSALATGSQILGIHHPQGDMQKMSFGKVSHRASCFQVGSRIYCYGLPNGNYYFVDWNRGLIEGGSSGSGLFHDGRLMGALSGGSLTPSCSGGNVATYASLESAFPALRQWLALPPEPPVTPGRAAVYRLFNTQTGAHFFTSNAAERDFVLATYPVFRYENIAFYAGAQPKPGLSSVHRFYNPASGAHFYTISEAEREYVRSAFPVFQYEGPAWYGSSKPVEGMVPVFRFYNPSTGAHFYTNSPDERDFVIATYPVFQYEGVAYYVWNTP
ncbi:trypsin-like peptidase domain-containing protein [Ottowia sp. VDI28]|uniref:trypsin-like peptidase domain-containing protein n=1 Tax=Ottowia sp. VDI28 TaxID=3133968 RepID=UPI003C2BAFC9